MNWQTKLKAIAAGDETESASRNWLVIESTLVQVESEFKQLGRTTNLEQGLDRIELSIVAKTGFEFTLLVENQRAPVLSFFSPGARASEIPLSNRDFSSDWLVSLILGLYAGSQRGVGVPARG